MRDCVEVQLDGHVVSGGDVCEQQEQRVVWRSGLVRLAMRKRKMLGTHFAETHGAVANDLLGAVLEFLPHLWTR